MTLSLGGGILPVVDLRAAQSLLARYGGTCERACKDGHGHGSTPMEACVYGGTYLPRCRVQAVRQPRYLPTHAALRRSRARPRAVWMQVSWYRHPDALDAMRWGPQLRQCASGILDGIAFGLGSSPRRRRPSCLLPFRTARGRRRAERRGGGQQNPERWVKRS